MRPQHESKSKFLATAMNIIRAKGYEATTVDDICAAAELSKGSFFYHFKSKEDLAVAAAQYWAETTGRFFANAPYHALNDPLERLLAYVDFRIAMLRGELPQFTCLVGTMVQEIYDSHPQIRAACEQTISGHAAMLEADIAAAVQQHGVDATWSAASLALHTQAVVQGAFVLAKAKNGPQIAADSLLHLRRYLQLLFNQPILKE